MGHKIKHKPKKKKEEIVEVVEEVEYNDQFVDIANKALNSTIKYKYIVFALIFISVAVAGTLAFMESNKKKNMANLSLEFSKATAVYNAEVVANSEAEGQFKTTKEKLTKSIEEFSAFISAHPKSELAAVSKMYIGNAYYELADYDAALKSYTEAIQEITNKDLKDVLMLKKAEILKLKKDNDKSIEAFTAVKDSENTYVASASLYQLAELYTLKKDDKKSKAMIAELSKKYPKSIFAMKAKSNKL